MKKLFNNDYDLLDACLRPTNKPWKCPYCKTTLLTTECIISHKERCTKPIKQVKKVKVSSQDQKERTKLLELSLREFKQKNNIK